MIRNFKFSILNSKFLKFRASSRDNSIVNKWE